MKKKFFAAVIMVLVFAVSAMAAPCSGKPGYDGQCMKTQRGHGPEMRQDLTPEQKVMMDDMRKLHEEIRIELQKSAPDKVKARELHNKLQDIKQKIEDQRFSERLSKPRPAKVFGKAERVLTPQQKVKMDQVRKLHDEIAAELHKETPDKAKAQALHTQLQKLNREIEAARFEEMLKNPARFAQWRKGPKHEEPKAVIAKMGEMRKLGDEISIELQKEIPNKAKIRELHKMLQIIKNDVDDMRLEEMLKNPEKFKNCSANFGNCPKGGHFRGLKFGQY